MTIAGMQFTKKDLGILSSIVMGVGVVLVAVLTAVFQFIGPIVQTPGTPPEMMLMMRDQTQYLSDIAASQRELVRNSNESKKVLEETKEAVETLNGRLGTAMNKQVTFEMWDVRTSRMENKLNDIGSLMREKYNGQN